VGDSTRGEYQFVISNVTQFNKVHDNS